MEAVAKGLMGEVLHRATPGSAHVAAITAAFDQHHVALIGYLEGLVRDRDIAEEIAQEAFLRLLERLRRGDGPDDSRAWLFTVATNLARTRLRRRLVAERWRHLFAGRDAGESPEIRMTRRETTEELLAAVATLPVAHRAAILLAAEDFTGPEIAAILGRSHGATRTLLFRARSMLRSRLAEAAR